MEKTETEREREAEIGKIETERQGQRMRLKDTSHKSMRQNATSLKQSHFYVCISSTYAFVNKYNYLSRRNSNSINKIHDTQEVMNKSKLGNN